MENTATNQVLPSTANNNNIRVTVSEAVIINSRRLENIEKKILGKTVEPSVSQTKLQEQMSELKNHTTKKTDMMAAAFQTKYDKLILNLETKLADLTEKQVKFDKLIKTVEERVESELRVNLTVTPKDSQEKAATTKKSNAM